MSIWICCPKVPALWLEWSIHCFMKVPPLSQTDLGSVLREIMGDATETAARAKTTLKTLENGMAGLGIYIRGWEC